MHRGELWLAVLVAFSTAIGGVGCASEGTLIVQVRTDLTPGVDFDQVRVELGLFEAPPSRSFEVDADPSFRWAAGVRAVEAGGLEPGTYTAVVSAVSSAGVVVERPARIDVRSGANVVTVLLTRDCIGVTCPTGDTPTAIACLGGRCVDEGCLEERADACGAPACTGDDDCSAVACADAECTPSGTCFATPVEARCDAEEVCDTSTGCVAVDAPGALSQVRPIYPWNGLATGSIHTPDNNPDGPHPLRPSFRWRPVSGAMRYEIQADPNCPVEDFRNCDFPTPTWMRMTPRTEVSPSAAFFVSTEAPVGTRYYWRVRACSASECGPWSETRYVDVGRMRDDFNGDGYSDLVVGSPDRDPGGVGDAVYYAGSSTGLAELGESLSGSEPMTGSFGDSLHAVGDMDGDGFSDLAVAEVDARAVHVYFGGPLGLPGTRRSARLDPESVYPPGYGSEVAAAGDVDGDGFADLLVGIEGNESLPGAALLLFGSPTAELLDAAMIGEEDAVEGAFFGADVSSAGDIQGDGYVDLIVGAYGTDTDAADVGAAFVYYGGPGRSFGRGVRLSPSDDVASGYFGSEVRGGFDLDGDGLGDLVVGAPGDPGARDSRVFIYLGTGTGVGDVPAQILVSPVSEPAWFGKYLDAGRDLDGDGCPDLAIGAPVHDEQNGTVYLYSCPVRSVSVAMSLTSPDARGLGAFGHAVRLVTDIDGDGLAELFVGEPEGDFAGRVWGFFGSATNLVDRDTPWGQVAVSPDTLDFGAALSRIVPSATVRLDRLLWPSAIGMPRTTHSRLLRVVRSAG